MSRFKNQYFTVGTEVKYPKYWNDQQNIKVLIHEQLEDSTNEQVFKMAVEEFGNEYESFIKKYLEELKADWDNADDPITKQDKKKGHCERRRQHCVKVMENELHEQPKFTHRGNQQWKSSTQLPTRLKRSRWHDCDEARSF